MRNAIHLSYPVVEAMQSILPLCDEFVVAAGDSTDGTTELLRSIDSPKLRIIETTWDPELYVRGAIFAQQTDIALDACSGDWAFYIQADEVVHERFLPVIGDAMRRWLGDVRVEGLLFDYIHFFGDFDHIQTSHNWYDHEVRIVRTGIGVRSWHDAQGFRRAGEKLHVAHSGACVYHYGWVRPPRSLYHKAVAFEAAYGRDVSHPNGAEQDYEYGRLWGLRRFEGTHPAVMTERIQAQRWTVRPSRNVGHKHDRVGVQMLSWIENHLLRRRLGERRNYILVDERDASRHALPWRRWGGAAA